jgi:translation initiation factor 3 subunit A
MSEKIMVKFIELCVALQRGKQAKDGLHQYRIVTQQIPSSLEVVLKTFLESATAAARDAQTKAEGILLEVEDLEEDFSAEQLLRAVSGEDTKDRTDREIVTPWLKFLWETYRTILEILRNNMKLEGMYKETTTQAFDFCLRYKRTNEFKRLNDLLRSHLQVLTKQKQLESSDTVQFQLEIRFAQLNTATSLELWQEAFRTAEDINNLIVTSKKAPTAHMLMNYYEKLARIFWVSEGYLYHAYAWNKYYELKQVHSELSADDSQILASQVLLAALSVPSVREEEDEFMGEFDSQKERNARMASLLHFSIDKRDSLVQDLLAKDINKTVLPELADLYNVFEQKFHPLEFGPTLKRKLDFIASHDTLKQYTKSISQLGFGKLLNQLAEVYQKIELPRLFKLADFVQPQEAEKLAVRVVLNKQVEARIDHRHNVIIFQSSTLQNDKTKVKVVQAAKNLAKVVSLITPEEKRTQAAEARRKGWASVLKGLEAEHKRTLNRRSIIEKIKEIREAQEAEQAKKIAQLEQAKQKEAAERQKAIAAQKAAEEQQKRLAKEKKEAEQRDALAIAQRLATTTKSKLSKQEEELIVHDPSNFVKIQLQKIQSERERSEQKLNDAAMRLEHLNRARREAEVPVLLDEYKKRQETEKVHWEQQRVKFLETHKQAYENAQRDRERLKRIEADRSSFITKIMASRKEEYERLNTEREKKLAAFREQRKQQEEEAKIREAQRQKDEEEAAKVREEQARVAAEVREARDKEIREQREKDAVANEAARAAEGPWRRPGAPAEGKYRPPSSRNPEPSFIPPKAEGERVRVDRPEDKGWRRERKTDTAPAPTEEPEQPRERTERNERPQRETREEPRSDAPREDKWRRDDAPREDKWRSNRDDRPPRDAPRDDRPPRDAPREDKWRRDDAPREDKWRSNRDAPRSDAPREDRPPRDAPRDDRPPRDAPREDKWRRDDAPREDKWRSNRDAPRSDAPREDRPPRDALPRDDRPPRDAPREDKWRRDDAPREDKWRSNRDAPRSDAPRSDAPRSNTGGSSRPPREEGWRNDRPPRDAPPRDDRPPRNTNRPSNAPAEKSGGDDGWETAGPKKKK